MRYTIKVLNEHLESLIEKNNRTLNLIRLHEKQLKELTNTHYKQQQNIASINEKINFIKNNPSN